MNLSRREKREFVVVNGVELRITEYIAQLATSINRAFPNTTIKAEVYRSIYRAFMKDGDPSAAKTEAERIVMRCQKQAIGRCSLWRRFGLWFKLYMVQSRQCFNRVSPK